MDHELVMRLRELLGTYKVLRDTGASGAQQRGRQFNVLLADLLKAWGIPAEHSIRGLDGRDEIDVAFSIADVNYILEAKWEAKAVSSDPTTKLERRLSNRPPGTRGILVSMSGYTKHALNDAKSHTNVLLLDRAHVEAMLCGLVGPHDLLRQLYARTAAIGGSYATLANTLFHKEPPPGSWGAATPGDPWTVVKLTTSGTAATLLRTGRWPTTHYPQAAAWSPPDDLLVTTRSGVVRVRLPDGTTHWELALHDCEGEAILHDDETLLVLCRGTAVRWNRKSKTLDLLGGALGLGTLMTGADGEVWVFGYSGGLHDGSVTLTKLGDRPGDEERHEIPAPAGIETAIWLDGQRFFLSGNGHSAMLDLADEPATIDALDQIPSPLPNPRTATKLTPHSVLIASNKDGLDAFVCRLDLDTGKSTDLVDLTVNRVLGMTQTYDDAGSARFLLLVDVAGNDPETRPLILEVRTSNS
ncbi:restriction endonuclease [Yinghuangia soli]|uniref:Restriction endonuclease n=1 Tax=Yinghuangia soli TaxID=2908204 RepID=A0AA41U9N1_9ACTN|nr:restriction endonuclease [Yinghuangia soli]MCF2533999.1 restriction endonuclease [Yinghuangia soli]